MSINEKQDVCEKGFLHLINMLDVSSDFHISDINALEEKVASYDSASEKIVIFGGGSGLSNVVGGDSKKDLWLKKPFTGIKEYFPNTTSIVCVTDDGGSTGEVLKDLPIISIGDIRHVLLSSIQSSLVKGSYSLDCNEAEELVKAVTKVFNYRFFDKPENAIALITGAGVEVEEIPEKCKEKLRESIQFLFEDTRLVPLLNRDQCLGNLLIISTIFQKLTTDIHLNDIEKSPEIAKEAIFQGLKEVCSLVGVPEDSVLPCSCTPAQLRFTYSDGVRLRGEYKSSLSRRGFPVENVTVEYVSRPYVDKRVIHAIKDADVLIMAPGSLYSSIVPVFQLEEIAESVRENTKALKLLIANLWVQQGETDLVAIESDRRYRVSDMLAAYEKNIPGGTKGLFQYVLCLSLKNVQASILQKYAVEGKAPIYLDKDVVKERGFFPIECDIISTDSLRETGVVQHDTESLARVVKGLRCVLPASLQNREQLVDIQCLQKEDELRQSPKYCCGMTVMSLKYKQITEIVDNISFENDSNCVTQIIDERNLKEKIIDVIWKHQDIPVGHLQFVRGVYGIDVRDWKRDQKWDNVFSYYDPEDQNIYIRGDQFKNRQKFETAFLIALGESLLGKYAKEKKTRVLYDGENKIGKVYCLTLQKEEKWNNFFSFENLVEYLTLSRMCISKDPYSFTRVLNGEEGFTPPGLLMGLLYVWYLDNRLASHIECKMSVLKVKKTELIPEQIKLSHRRQALIRIFREKVFT